MAHRQHQFPSWQHQFVRKIEPLPAPDRATLLFLWFVLAGLVSIPCAAQAGEPTGACCSPTGVCIVTTEANCDRGGRDYQGDGTSCDPNPCEALTGACCFSDFSCQILEIDECAAAWGIFAGDGIPCDPTPCTEPIGACCLVGDLCAMSNFDNCFFGDGEYQGHGTSCATQPCDPLASVGDGRNSAQDLVATGIFLSLPAPNPSPGPVRFSIALVEPGQVYLQTLDIGGRILREESVRVDAGEQAWTWYPEHSDGRSFAPGVYYVRMSVVGGSPTRRATRTILVTK